MAFLMVRFMRSTWPLVQGALLWSCVFEVVRGAGMLEGMGSEALSVGEGFLDEWHEPPAPGVVNWMPLSVRTVWIL